MVSFCQENFKSVFLTTKLQLCTDLLACALADYGFTKLIELFEAIPLTVEITEDADGERLLQVWPLTLFFSVSFL